MEMIYLSFIVVGLVSLYVKRVTAAEMVRLEQTGPSEEKKLVAIVGDDDRAEELTRMIAQHRNGTASVTRLSTDEIEKWMRGAQFSDDHWPLNFDEVFISELVPEASPLGEFAKQMLRSGKKVAFLPGLLNSSHCKVDIGEAAPGLTQLVASFGGLRPRDAAIKRLIDMVLSFVLLGLLSPVFILLGLAIWLTSGLPIFFCQERVGRSDVQFKLYKFRTMRPDAEAVLRQDPILYNRYRKNNYKLPLAEDIRVTPLGRYLRAFSLDELPQLFNVLKGDMSIVGPRPVIPSEVERFGEFAPFILSVKPGITGPWQVNGRTRIADYNQRVALNMKYIRDWSLGRDFVIIAKTLPAVLRPQDAA